MRVLIVKTSSMGDVLHTLPALTRRRAGYPRHPASTGWLKRVSRRSPRHESVERVIPVAIRRWRKALVFRADQSRASSLSRGRSGGKV